ncbi:ABC transporter ATP-binding protein, partial [Acinetobacter baumannii]
IVGIKDRLGIPMIWIEHDMQMVDAIANRVHVLDYSRSIGGGAPKTVLRDEGVIRAYLSTAQVA